MVEESRRLQDRLQDWIAIYLIEMKRRLIVCSKELSSSRKRSKSERIPYLELDDLPLERLLGALEQRNRVLRLVEIDDEHLDLNLRCLAKLVELGNTLSVHHEALSRSVQEMTRK